jgi:hypothetical protein
MPKRVEQIAGRMFAGGIRGLIAGTIDIKARKCSIHATLAAYLMSNV